MRVMIAGADYSTLSSLDSCLSNLGHVSTLARNGLECRAGLCEFVPDLLVMELDVFWTGYDEVMSTLTGNPELSEIPVVFFTEFYKQLPVSPYPRIIARLHHPFRAQDLSKLVELLDNMELELVANLFSHENRHWTANREHLLPTKIEHGDIHQPAFNVSSIFSQQR